MKNMVLALLLTLIALPVVAGGSDTTISPVFDLRVRQEVLDNVYYFDPNGDTDRNWVRIRSRAGAALESGNHRAELRLANEARAFVHPDDQDFYWDELIIDRAFWRWRTSESATLTIGRQDIIWNRGFLMLDGSPLDGSRAIYHNAARMQAYIDDWELDLSLIVDPKYDPIVLVTDNSRPLTDADEWAAALRVGNNPWQGSFIWKVEDDPDGNLPWLRTATLDVRFDARFGETGKIWAEMAAQHQDFDTGGVWCDAGYKDGWGVAGQIFARSDLSRTLSGEIGGFYYSGDDGDEIRAFRTPWGRWPKWSELYIYALIGESTPGRVHVAAWENVAAPRAMLRLDLSGRIEAHLGASYLVAPEPDWQSRGLLMQAGVEFDMVDLAPGLKSHLIYELFDPGSFYTDQLDPDLTKNWSFLRWQISYALK